MGVMSREGSGHKPMTVLATRSFSHVQRPVTRYWATVQRQSRRGDRDGFGAPGGGPSRSASGDFVLKSPALSGLRPARNGHPAIAFAITSTQRYTYVFAM